MIQKALYILKKPHWGLVFGLLLAAAISVIAFSEPSQAPPAGNVPASLNVSATPQTKAGDLTVNNFFAKNFSVAPGVSEYNISNVNTVSGFNDLFLKGNSTETAPLYLAGSEIRAYAGGIERLTIMGTGNVGIGVSTPGSKLTVAGIIESLSGGFKFPDGTVQTTAAAGGGGFWTAGGANISNTNSGNVGIGTTDFPTVNAFGVSKSVKLNVMGIINSGDLFLVSGGDIGTWFGTPNVPRSWFGKCPAGTACSGIVKGGDYFHISGWSNANYGSVDGNAKRVLGLADVVIISDSLGINTGDQSRAKLVTAGMVGNTSALFGQGTQGVSLVSNWPGIAFNSYFKDGVWKSISSGWTGDLSYIASVSPSNGGFVFRTGEWATGPDQIVGHQDVFQINNDGVATFHGSALVMDGVGKGKTDFVMRGDRGSGGRALVLDWGDTLKINYANDFAGGVEVNSKIVVPGNPIGIRGQLSLGGDYYGWGNRECIGCGDSVNGAPNLWLTAQDQVRVRAPNGLYVDNNINANDVFIRAAGKWASQMGGGGTVNAGSVSSGTFGANTGGGDYVFPSRISSQNLSPACPNGWGCGVHTWDLYADSAVGAGNFITAPNKFFIIPHPLDPENKSLIHATLEGPELGVFYRGEAQLANGRAVVMLPDYFEALTRKESRTVLLTNVDSFDQLAVESQNGELVKDWKFIVVSSNKNSSQRFIWEVKAVRADVKPLRVERDKNELPYDEDQLPAGVKKP